MKKFPFILIFCNETKQGGKEYVAGILGFFFGFIG
jgi:hypothetical protein